MSSRFPAVGYRDVVKVLRTLVLNSTAKGKGVTKFGAGQVMGDTRLFLDTKRLSDELSKAF